MEIAITIFALSAVVGWNIAATIRVAGSKLYDDQKKRAQYLLIWLLPVAGATVSYFMAKDESTKRLTTDLTEKSEKCDCDLRMNSASGNTISDLIGND